ncbi:MAG: HD domain-containing phosphohydrolase [Planctomycetota bacterium]
MTTSSSCRVLLVDDEQALLDALQRTYRKRFRFSTACGGPAGLEAIQNDGPFDVVVSDYQMPEMNGAAFLSRVAEVAPESVRIMLTGNADLQTAIDAVNTGQVFRFLTKPCDPDVFTQGIDAAFEQVRLRRAERDLLQGTLKGSIEVLADVLSLSNPDAFGRANRVRSYVAQLAKLLKMPDTWQVESAAMLSQIGCVALPGDLLELVASGQVLSDAQSEAYEQHPGIGARLLSHIPRLGPVAEIVRRQRSRLAELAKEKNLAPEVKRGSQVLAACLELDELISLGASKTDALDAMAKKEGAYPPQLLRVMADLRPLGADTVARDAVVAELQDGMILGQDVRGKGGTLIVAKGNRITTSLLERLRNYHHLRGVEEPIRVLVAPSAEAAEAA